MFCTWDSGTSALHLKDFREAERVALVPRLLFCGADAVSGISGSATFAAKLTAKLGWTTGAAKVGRDGRGGG